MIDVTELAVPHTLARLVAVLPPPPARVVEVGCGRGALAAALSGKGYQVTGVDPDEEACAAAAARGVDAICADITDFSGGPPCDAVLFTRSLHHVDDLDASLAHALGLVAPGGLVVLEEFARERADHATTGFLYDSRTLLVAAGVLELPDDMAPVDPAEDPVQRWERERGAAADRPLHTGAAMRDALAATGARVESTVDTETLWRLLTPPGGGWRLDDGRLARLLGDVRAQECRRIGEGTLRPLGMFVVARRQDGSTSRS